MVFLFPLDFLIWVEYGNKANFLIQKYFLFKGGFKAVIWADVFQSIIIVIGIFAILIQVRFFFIINRIKIEETSNCFYHIKFPMEYLCVLFTVLLFLYLLCL
jgi:Na+/proline symporter